MGGEGVISVSKLIPLYAKRYTVIAAYTVVDAARYDELSKWRWLYMKHLTTPGYAIRREGRKTILMHRVIANAQPSERIDHINGNSLDNQASNLRPATAQQNGRNSRKPQRENPLSRFKGVTFHKPTRKWRAIIVKSPRTCTSLGYFHNEIEAARAYDAAARECFGEFARTNFDERS